MLHIDGLQSRQSVTPGTGCVSSVTKVITGKQVMCGRSRSRGFTDSIIKSYLH